MTKHISVLLNEAIEGLNLQDTSIIVDATLGYGGHSANIMQRIKKGHLFAFDQDSEAIRHSTSRLAMIGTNFTIIKSNFKNMKEELEKLGITEVDGVLFDLGVSSPQLDEVERGFSYHEDARLDMRMDKSQNFSAYDVVNNYTYEQLVNIFYKYGEDSFSRQIARKIVSYRENKNIETTLELVDIIKSAVPVKDRLKKHPARQIFQAIRIEVNHELDVLEEGLDASLALLKVGGRCCVITFHSLEDRIVKNKFKSLCEVDKKVQGLPEIPDSYLPNYRLITKKAIKPSAEEIISNNRSRSALLRIIERVK